MKTKTNEPKFVVCVRNHDADDLEIRKIYQVIPDEAASADGLLRIVDESGEDYMYPSDLFVPVKLPAAVVRRLKKRTDARTPAVRRSMRRAG